MNSFDLFGIVGSDVRSDDVRRFLKDNKGLPVRITIDSPGGSLSEGVLIHNMLLDHSGEVTTVNAARAYSIASYIFLAGSIREMNDNSLLMTHEARIDASSLTESNCDQMKSMLAAANASIRKAYARIMGVDESMIQTLWDGANDVWYTSDEALEAGIATQIISAGSVMSAEYLSELVALAPAHVSEMFTRRDNMSDKVTIEALEAIGCDPGFILSQIKKGATKVDAYLDYINHLRAEEVSEEDEEEGKAVEAEEAEEPSEEAEEQSEEGEDPSEEPAAEEGEEPAEEPEAEEGGSEEAEEPAAEEGEEDPKAEEMPGEEDDEEEEKDGDVKAKTGVEPVAVARSSNGQFSSATHAWKQQIADRCRETGCSTVDAVLFLNKNNPGLRQLVIDEANNKR